MKNLALIIFLVLLLSCIKSLPVDSENSSSDKKVCDSCINLRLILKSNNEILKTKGLLLENIGNVSIFIFGIDEKLISHNYFQNASDIDIKTSTGFKTIIALANIGPASYTQIRTLTDIKNLKCYNYYGTNNNAIYAGETSIYIKPTTKDKTLYLRRLLTKITFLFDKSALDSNVTIDITRIELKNVPKSCYYLKSNTATHSEISLSGEYLDVNLEPLDRSSASPLYMFENLQGVIGTNNDPYQKSPGNKFEVSTYAEISAMYNGPKQSGEIKYRYYLGDNSTNNFNIERESHYNETVKFTGSSIKDVSWRVDVSNLVDIKYNITAEALPKNGGSFSGNGFYLYGQIPSLSAIPAPNYSFSGWVPPLSPVTKNQNYVAVFSYTSPKIDVTDISICCDKLSLDVNQGYKFTSKVFPANATDQFVSWSNTNQIVATLDQAGYLLAINPGNTKITVTSRDGFHSKSCFVTVFKIVELFFHTKRVITKNGDNIDQMDDYVYVKCKGGNDATLSFAYQIKGPIDDSGLCGSESGNITFVANNSLNLKIGSVGIITNYEDIQTSSITISNLFPEQEETPPTKYIINQRLNTYSTEYR